MERSRKQKLSLRREVLQNTVKTNVCINGKKEPTTPEPEVDFYKKYLNYIVDSSKGGEWNMGELITVKQWKKWISIYSLKFKEQWKFGTDKALVEFADVLMGMFFDETNPYLHRVREFSDNNQIALLFRAKEIYDQEQNEKFAAKAEALRNNASVTEDNVSLDVFTFDVKIDDGAPLERYSAHPDSPKCIRDRSVSPNRIFETLQPPNIHVTNQPKTNSALSRNRNKRRVSNASSLQSVRDDQRKRHRSANTNTNCSVHHALNIKIIPRNLDKSPPTRETHRSVEKKSLTDEEIIAAVESNCVDDDMFENSCSYPADEDIVYENPTPPCSPACIQALDLENVSHGSRSDVGHLNRDNFHSSSLLNKSVDKMITSPSVTSPGQKIEIKCTSSTNQKFKPSESKIFENRKKGITIRKQTPSKEPLTQSGGNKPAEDSFELPDIEPEPHVDQSSPPIEQDKENYPVSVDEIAVKYPKPPTAPALTLEMFEELKNILDRPPKEKVVTGFSLYILQEDLAVYNKDTEWLNDRNIDFYLELIRERSTRPGYQRAYIFHSFFYTLLTDKDGGYEFVQETTGEDDLFKYDIVFFPVHLNHHWRLVVVKFSEKSMKCYDSMNHDNADVLKNIGKYLKREYRRKHRNNNNPDNTNPCNGLSEDERMSPVPIAISNGVESIKTSMQWFFNSSLWTVENVSSESIPQQKNAIDCGIFLLQYAEYLSREKEFDFDQSHIPYFRKRIMYETLTKQLLTAVRNENAVKSEEVGTI